MLAGCEAATESANDNAPFELTGRVVDHAEIFDAPFEVALTERLRQLEDETQVQLVVATTPDLEGYSIADYSYNLANSWGIGSAERDDGLLVLLAPSERTVRIEVGFGLEASVRDEEAAEIIQKDMLPRFRKSDFEGGVERGVESLIQEVTSVNLEKAA